MNELDRARQCRKAPRQREAAARHLSLPIRELSSSNIQTSQSKKLGLLSFLALALFCQFGRFICFVRFAKTPIGAGSDDHPTSRRALQPARSHGRRSESGRCSFLSVPARTTAETVP